MLAQTAAISNEAFRVVTLHHQGPAMVRSARETSGEVRFSRSDDAAHGSHDLLSA